MSDPNFESEFERLLEQLSIDKLDDSQWRTLAEKIASDDEALRGYIETVHWRQSLAYLVGRGADSDRSHDALPETAGEASVATTSRTAASDATLHNATDRFRTWFGAWMVAATLAFIAGAGITALALRNPLATTVNNTAVAPQDIAPVAALQPPQLTQDNQLGKVTGLSLDASADGLLRSLQVGQELRCGEVVQFTQGFMRVALHDGPELLVEGPAEFSLVAKDSVFVRYGRVSAGATGSLLLQSPLVMAECKDAEVSFNVDEDAVSNIFAHRGIVTMRSNAQPGIESVQLGMLHAGEGVRVTAESANGPFEQVAIAEPHNAVRNWSQVEAQLMPYETLVLADRPLAYWPLYHVRRNRRVLDLTQHGYDGQAIGNWPVELNEATATDERGAHFNGESYIEPDRKPPVDPRRGFTVEGWAKVQGGPAYQSIFTSRWVLDTFTPQRQCIGFTLYAGENDRWQFWTGSGKYGELWKELHTNIPVARGDWTHVVATFEPKSPADGKPAESVVGTVKIYVDGQLAATGDHELSLLDTEFPARIGAAEFVPNSLTAWLFRGGLRDIAIYDYPLDPERISVHHEAGKRRTETLGRSASRFIPPSATRS